MLNLIPIIINFIGALAILLYGMNMLSDGVQKGAASSLQRLLGIVSGNRFTAVLTGLLVTAIIQSSGATTVMVVSFVNAQIISLTQAIGIIFGANIGTTVTAWIVSLFGFSFKISAFAIPLFGFGFFITCLKKWNLHSLGEILMGFGLLFFGLSLLGDSLTLSEDSVAFLKNISEWGVGGLLLGVLVGAFFTALIHSSSAMTAIVLTMAANGSLTWEFSAAVVLGSNIGSTIDAILSAMGSSTNAKRAALVHVCFNIAGTVIALIVFKPFLALIDFIVPKAPVDNITTHIAMLHTIFNICCTCIFLPFVNQIAALVSKVIKHSNTEEDSDYKLPMIFSSGHGSVELYVLQAEKEVEKMAAKVMLMFNHICTSLDPAKKEEVTNISEEISKYENYVDQMMEEITDFLVKCSQLDGATGIIQNKITQLQQIIDYLETLSDESTRIIHNIEKYLSKKQDKKLTSDKILTYMKKVCEFYEYVVNFLGTGLSKSQRSVASKMEDEIDEMQRVLKKSAKKRLEDGGDVKSLLRYIDIVRRIENAGDSIYALVRLL
jgi:phosphate:Na+ symporter